MNRTHRRASGFAAWRLLAVPVLLLATLGWSLPARAQESGAIDIQMFRPNPHVLGTFTVDSARLLPHLDWNVGLFLNYAKNPLRRVRTDTGETVRRFVTDQLAADLLFELGLFDFFSFGIDLPVNLYMDGEGLASRPDGLAQSGLGDLRLIPKFQILDLAEIFYLGVAMDLQLPTGDDDNFMSRGTTRFIPRLNLEVDLKVVEILLNVGFRLQSARQLYNLVPENEWYVSLGAFAPFQLGGGHRLDVIAETSLRASIEDAFDKGNETGFDLRAGLRYHLPFGLVVSAGAGGGLLPGYGEPDYRIFVGVQYNGKPGGDCPDPDPDQDCDRLCDPWVGQRGIDRIETRCAGRGVCKEMLDGMRAEQCEAVCTSTDQCPLLPEDYDGYQDEDGCPDPDNDGDGICDPWVAKNGMQERYAEICFGSDLCPNLPEDFDGWHDEDGCPEPDNDCDRVCDPGLDDLFALESSREPWERCPNSEFAVTCPEHADDPEATCPRAPICRKDTSGDLLEDVCPTAPESYNHKGDDDGCPDCVVSFELPSGELFEHDRYFLKPGAKERLEEVARVLLTKRWRDLSFVVEGHASDVYRGTAWAMHDYNVKLSHSRAEAIRAFLMGKKEVRGFKGVRRFSETIDPSLVIDEERLTAVGYGWERPKEPVPFGFEGRANAGEKVDEEARPEVKEWRASCRRVEFRPIGKPAIDDGCDAEKPACILCR